MTASRPVSPLRAARICAAPALSGLLALGTVLLAAPAATAAAAGASSGGSAVASGTGTPASGSGAPGASPLQVRAQELAGQITADSQTLDQLDEAYNAAQISLQAQQSERSALSREMAASAVQVKAAHRALTQDAVVAYMTGGAPIIDRPGELASDNADLTLAYASIVAGGAKADEDRYRATLATQAKEQAALVVTEHDESLTLADIAADRSQAATTLAAQQATLAQINGQLAVAVAAVQAQQQAAEQAQVTGSPERLSGGNASSGGPAGADRAPDSGSPGGPGAGSPGPPPVTGSPGGPGAGSPGPPLATGSPTTDSSGHRPITGSPTTVAPTTAAPATTVTTVASSGSGSGGSVGSPGSGGSDPAQAPGVNAVLSYARAQLGKPYQWGGAGPNSFDCSGLVMMAWAQAGIDFPHLAQDQYDMTARIPLADMIPGDLVFYGTPDDVYHVGIYIGNGNMIDAPETGQNVSVQNIYWSSLLGAGRVTTSS